MEQNKHFHTEIKDLPKYRGYDVPVTYRDSAIVGNSRKSRLRVMVGIPTTGLVRMEWVISRYGQVIPCNWSQTDTLQWLDQHSPVDFLVADARNICAHHCLSQGFEWLFFIDHDTVIPPFTILAMNERMLKGNVPIWSGLYFTKSKPSEPLIYRGRGTGYYTDWKLGDEVWVDGLPMGCTMIHSSILTELAKISDPYEVRPGMTIRKIFETPAKVWFDPELRSWYTFTGTEDLQFCMDIINEGILKKAGWDEIAEKEFPFLVDTNIFCRHIDNDGVQYPANGEEYEFMTDEQKEAINESKAA
jgi:hypothetical protein